MGKYYTNDVEFSSGLGRFIHMLTWPIRKFYIIVPVATLIYVTPIFFDVKPNEVHLWYKEKSIELYDKSMENEYVKISADKIGSWVDVVKSWFSSESDGKTSPKTSYTRKTTKGKGNEVLVDMPKPQNIQRKAFNKTKKSEVVPVEVQGLETAAFSDDSVNISAVEILNSETPNLTIGSLSNGSLNVSDLINPEKKMSSLVYLKTSKIIKGEAKVINANEMEVAGVYVLLYGIYVNPNSVVGKDAAQYLESRTASSEVKCNIIAYTYQNVATAICFVDNENLNKKLVDKNLTKNVAL